MNVSLTQGYCQFIGYLYTSAWAFCNWHKQTCPDLADHFHFIFRSLHPHLFLRVHHCGTTHNVIPFRPITYFSIQSFASVSVCSTFQSDLFHHSLDNWGVVMSAPACLPSLHLPVPLCGLAPFWAVILTRFTVHLGYFVCDLPAVHVFTEIQIFDPLVYFWEWTYQTELLSGPLAHVYQLLYIILVPYVHAKPHNQQTGCLLTSWCKIPAKQPWPNWMWKKVILLKRHWKRHRLWLAWCPQAAWPIAIVPLVTEVAIKGVRVWK